MCAGEQRGRSPFVSIANQWFISRNQRSTQSLRAGFEAEVSRVPAFQRGIEHLQTGRGPDQPEWLVRPLGEEGLIPDSLSRMGSGLTRSLAGRVEGEREWKAWNRSNLTDIETKFSMA
jgi:hypothetical protein